MFFVAQLIALLDWLQSSDVVLRGSLRDVDRAVAGLELHVRGRHVLLLASQRQKHRRHLHDAAEHAQQPGVEMG